MAGRMMPSDGAWQSLGAAGARSRLIDLMRRQGPGGARGERRSSSTSTARRGISCDWPASSQGGRTPRSPGLRLACWAIAPPIRRIRARIRSTPALSRSLSRRSRSLSRRSRSLSRHHHAACVEVFTGAPQIGVGDARDRLADQGGERALPQPAGDFIAGVGRELLRRSASPAATWSQMRRPSPAASGVRLRGATATLPRCPGRVHAWTWTTGRGMRAAG